MDSKDLISRIEGELGSAGEQDPSALLHPPPRVADHELVRRIGAGSYGEVWLARAVTGQWRAVKAVSRDRFSSDRPYEREFRGVVQFEPISRAHSGLVQVLHVGRDDSVGAFYYVMELADDAKGVPVESVGNKTILNKTPATRPHPAIDPGIGDYSPRTLRSDLKARGRLPVAEAVTLGVELAGALGHIHRHGLVHRDVKPSNVIFVQGRPKLADLGLVTSTSEARSFVGTEGFIPPEGPGTVKADLFALGRLLYEAVTGKDRCEFPELPRDLDAWPNREEFLEFNEVVTQLCAPEPERRYANAAEVAGDLNLILAGRSVRRANGIERRLRQARRITVATLVGLAVAAGVMWLQQSRQEQAETRAAHERTLRERAEVAERVGQQQLFTALLEQARATVRGGEIGQRVKALDAVRRAAAITNTADLRREALTALTLPDARWRRDLPLGLEFTGKDPDPSFERIAVCRGRGPVQVLAISNLAVLATLPASTNLMCWGLFWSADGRFLAAKRDYDAAGSGSDLEVWDLRGEPRRTLLIHNARFNGWSFHPHKPELVVAVGRNQLINWNVERGEELARIDVEVTPEQLKYSPDARLVAAAYRRNDGWGVSVHPAGELETLASHVFASSLGGIDWHPQGRWVAVTDLSGAVHLLSPETGETRLLGRHRGEAVNVAFDPTGDYLVTGGWERALICWDLRAMQRAFSIELDAYVARFSANGSTLAVLRGGDVQLFDFERPTVVREVPVVPASQLRYVTFAPDGRKLAASADHALVVYDVETGDQVTLGSDGGRALFWNMEGTELFASGGGPHRWGVRTSPGRALDLEKLPITRPAGFNALSVVSNRVLWTARGGSQLTTVEDLQTEDAPWRPTWRGNNGQSPDGRWAGVFAPNSPRLQIYEMPAFTSVLTLTNSVRTAGFTFSPSSREMVVMSRGRLEVFETGRWERLRETTNVAGVGSQGAIFHPDERGLWFASDTRHSGLFNAKTFDLLLPLPVGHMPAAVSADGRKLAASADGRRLIIWDLVQARALLRELGLDWADPGP